MNRTVQTVQEDVDAIVPYSMHVSSRYLALTKQKLELTRLPRENETLGPAEQWALGTPKSVLEPLLDHWLETYDWRAEEDAFNSTLPQFRTRVSLSPGARGGDQKPARTHFVHKRSAHASAVPLLYCHSWPGSFVEVQRIIDQLASPEGEGELAFHVVCPSIPGFGFSDASEDPQFGVHGAAEVFAGLMRRLGYERWVVCGSGWGFEICRALAIREPKRCLAVHTCNPQFNAPTVKDQPLLWVKWHLARLTKAKYLPSDELWIPPLRAYRSTTDVGSPNIWWTTTWPNDAPTVLTSPADSRLLAVRFSHRTAGCSVGSRVCAGAWAICKHKTKITILGPRGAEDAGTRRGSSWTRNGILGPAVHAMLDLGCLCLDTCLVRCGPDRRCLERRLERSFALRAVRSPATEHWAVTTQPALGEHRHAQFSSPTRVLLILNNTTAAVTVIVDSPRQAPVLLNAQQQLHRLLHTAPPVHSTSPSWPAYCPRISTLHRPRQPADSFSPAPPRCSMRQEDLSVEAQRLTPFRGAKPRIFPPTPDLPNVLYGRSSFNTPAAGTSQPLQSSSLVGLLSSAKHRIACLSSRLCFTARQSANRYRDLREYAPRKRPDNEYLVRTAAT
ncbi:hypothetical protein ST47_g174 [Ascochyta rabiei]|uniref:Epoxide hydrolase N-terminal domain-containing protein n=1 Tax=Didymella rabiei TaxID=5454 RepID=A0A163MFT8_DIDRA|nr:hypothetical protein ST47_g174 [Ascochyta rabiei]